MEAASIPQPKAPPTTRRTPGKVIWDNILWIIIALALVGFVVHDLIDYGNVTPIAENLKKGLSTGAIWALIALGYTLVYGIIELINFAHGEVFMIGGFTATSMFATLGLATDTSVPLIIVGMLVALLTAMFISGSLNVMIERAAYRPLRHAPKLAPLITAIGMSFILLNVGLLWRPTPDSPPDLIRSQDQLVDFFGVNIVRSDVFAIGVTVPLLLVLLLWFVGQTRYGKAMRATAQDPEAARLMGIDVNKTISLTFLLGGLMAGAAGPDLRPVQPDGPLQHGLHRRSDRLHRSGDGRHRQPQGSGARRRDHRLRAADSRGAAGERLRLGAGRRVRDPRAGDGVPTAGPVRRGGPRGMSTQTQTPPPAVKPTGEGGLKGLGETIGNAFRSVAALLPTWVWALLWLGVVIIYGLVGLDMNQSLYEASINTLGYVMMALGLNIVVGFAGLLDLGYVAFYAIGAFVFGWLASGHFRGSEIYLGVPEKLTLSGDVQPGIHINIFIILVLAAAFTALWGAILGAPTLRLRGDYLAIVTLAFGEIVPRVFEFSQSGPFGIGDIDLSNGRQGITPVDLPYFPGILEDVTRTDVTPFFFIALVMCIVVLFVNYTLRDSRLGRAWIAVREDEVAAAAMGVPLVRVKLWAYAIGAAIGGFAGAFLGAYKSTINVDQFEFSFSVFILCMVIIGGMGNIAGVILGAIALSMIDRFLLPELNGVPDSFGLDFDVTSISGGIFGFLLLAMMVLRPQGFIPNRRRKLELTEDVVDDTQLSSVRS